MHGAEKWRVMTVKPDNLVLHVSVWDDTHIMLQGQCAGTPWKLPGSFLAGGRPHYPPRESRHKPCRGYGGGRREAGGGAVAAASAGNQGRFRRWLEKRGEGRLAAALRSAGEGFGGRMHNHKKSLQSEDEGYRFTPLLSSPAPVP